MLGQVISHSRGCSIKSGFKCHATGLQNQYNKGYKQKVVGS